LVVKKRRVRRKTKKLKGDSTLFRAWNLEGGGDTRGKHKKHKTQSSDEGSKKW